MDCLRYCATLFLIGGLVVAVSCTTAKDLSRTLTDLGQVRAQIIKRFGEEAVNVNVNTFQGNTTVSVIFINSTLNTGSQGIAPLRIATDHAVCDSDQKTRLDCFSGQ